MFPILRALMCAMEAVNRGEGMTFHPIVGKRLADCGYDVDRSVHIVMEPAIVPEQKFLPPILGKVEGMTVRWTENEPTVELEFSRSDWKFDPETGLQTDNMPPKGGWGQD
jgi:hypothetical protein